MRGSGMLTQEMARRRIEAEWHALPPERRADDAEFVIFAMQMKDKHAFRCSGDRYQVVKGWLFALRESERRA